MVPHNRRPSGSGFAWTDADPGPGGENPRSQCFGCIFNESGSGNANRNKLTESESEKTKNAVNNLKYFHAC